MPIPLVRLVAAVLLAQAQQVLPEALEALE
jgi:hypothetical protein